MIYTVFPKVPEGENVEWDCRYDWQDFPTLQEAKAYQKEILEDWGIESEISSTDGEVV